MVCWPGEGLLVQPIGRLRDRSRELALYPKRTQDSAMPPFLPLSPL